MSARLGYQNWNELLEELRKATRQHDRLAPDRGMGVRSTADITWRAEVYRQLLQTPVEGEPDRTVYEKILERHFAPRRHDDAALRSFARLPIRLVLTTNYDHSLEDIIRRACGQRPRTLDWSFTTAPGELMRSFLQPRARRLIVHLHGHYRWPKGIVLTERDYEELYVRSDETVRKLFAIFSMRRALFLGFSMTDPDVMSMLRQVQVATRAPEGRHFAMVPVRPGMKREDREDERNRLRRKFGVVALFYSSANRHRNFEALMRHLASDASGALPAWLRAAPSPPVERRTVRLSKAPDWRKRHEFRRTRPVDPDDPQRGRFGGLASRDDLRLDARVEEDAEDRSWHHVYLEVRPSTPGRKLDGHVTFFVHPTFERERYRVPVRGGVAAIQLYAYGAFTVGALADSGRTPLELDLSTLRAAPRKFRDS